NGFSLLETGESPGWRHWSWLQSRRAYESVRSGLRLLAQTVQLPYHRARQAAPQHCSSLRNRGLRCLPRSRPRVPVRLVAHEDPRVRTPHSGGRRACHHRSRSQDGLSPAPGPFAKTQRPLHTVPANNLLFPGRVTKVPLPNWASLNHKEKTDEHKYEG